MKEDKAKGVESYKNIEQETILKSLDSVDHTPQALRLLSQNFIQTQIDNLVQVEKKNMKSALTYFYSVAKISAQSGARDVAFVAAVDAKKTCTKVMEEGTKVIQDALDSLLLKNWDELTREGCTIDNKLECLDKMPSIAYDHYDKHGRTIPGKGQYSGWGKTEHNNHESHNHWVNKARKQFFATFYDASAHQVKDFKFYFYRPPESADNNQLYIFKVDEVDGELIVTRDELFFMRTEEITKIRNKDMSLWHFLMDVYVDGHRVEPSDALIAFKDIHESEQAKQFAKIISIEPYSTIFTQFLKQKGYSIDQFDNEDLVFGSIKSPFYNVKAGLAYNIWGENNNNNNEHDINNKDKYEDMLGTVKTTLTSLEQAPNHMIADSKILKQYIKY